MILIDDDTRHVVAIGLRDEHAIYRAAIRSVTGPSTARR